MGRAIKMKTKLKVIITLMLGATVVVFSAIGAGFEAGSSEAAQKLVPEYLGRLYTVTETPKVNGNRATVKASLLDLSCTLELVRSVNANDSGWVVDKVDCNKS